MSVVIAKKYKNGFILAADSGCFKDQERGEAEKIFKLDYSDDTYVGGVGTLAEVQKIKYLENLIDPNAIKRDLLDEKSIITYTVPSLRKQLAKLLGSGKPLDRWDSEIIIVRKDKAFLISFDFSVQEIKDFEVIGAPESFCKGAYATLLSNPFKVKRASKDLYRYETIAEEKLVVELIKMTFKQTIYTFYPIKYINTVLDRKEQFQIVKGGIVEYPPEVG